MVLNGKLSVFKRAIKYNKNKNTIKIIIYKMETSYNIIASITTTQTYIDMLAISMGWQATINQFNPETSLMETVDNSITKTEFVKEKLHQILVNETTRPIQSMIYNEATSQAASQYEIIRQRADAGIEVIIEENNA